MFDKRPYLTCIFCLVLVLAGSVPSEAQPKKPARPAIKVEIEEFRTIERLHFRVTIDADKAISLSSVAAEFEKRDLDLPTLQKTLRDNLQLQSKPGKPPLEPGVNVTVDPSVDVATLAGVVRSLRITKNTNVIVDLPDGEILEISQSPEFKVEELRPNPLFLVINVDSEGRLTLNNEPQGALSNFAPLRNRLKDIFKRREVNGVFRRGTYDVEKTVWLKVPPELMLVDLQKVASEVRQAGSDRIGLQVDDLSSPTVPARKSMVSIN